MSDVTLRDLERRWRESGAPDDAARWHLARLRAGALRPEALELAAWCGDVAAGAALGPSAPTRQPAELLAWVAALGQWGAVARVVAAAAGAEHALEGAGVDRGDAAYEALARARAWAERPCVERSLAAVRAADALPFGWRPERERTARLSARAAALAVVDASRADEALRQASASAGSEAAVRATVDHALVRWALG